jgi:hypothetical protein
LPPWMSNDACGWGRCAEVLRGHSVRHILHCASWRSFVLWAWQHLQSTVLRLVQIAAHRGWLQPPGRGCDWAQENSPPPRHVRGQRVAARGIPPLLLRGVLRWQHAQHQALILQGATDLMARDTALLADYNTTARQSPARYQATPRQNSMCPPVALGSVAWHPILAELVMAGFTLRRIENALRGTT